MGKKIIKLAIILIIIIAPVFIYLTVKAQKNNSWDDWGFGSAQTILTARYWARDGFLKHKLYFIPSGYYENIEFLDKPEFRFLAWGTATGELIGKRLYYTHYPSGYLIPYGLLAKAGAESRFLFRMLAICFSFASVFFLFGFIYLITNRNKWMALLSAFFYSTSTTFLRFADSLNNTPVDDFFKWAILFFSVYALGREDIRGRLEKLIWLLYFLLAASSYDSTFFIFFWLCALGYIVTKKIDIKKYLFWASAPVLAFLLQVAQNTWYLGFKDMILDFKGALIFRASKTPLVLDYLPPVIKNLAASLSTSGFFLDTRTIIALPVILFVLYFFYRREIISKTIFKYIFALGVAGLIYPFLLPITGTFGYQGRQLAPALLLIFSVATYEAILMIKNLKIKKMGILFIVAIMFLWVAHFKATSAYVKDWPNNTIEERKIEYWQNINNITNKKTIILGTEDVLETGANLFFEEAYVDRLILSFKNTDELFFYVDKINSATSGQANFLIILRKEESGATIEAMKKNNLSYIFAAPNLK